jgi:hypothetical protein
MPYQGVILKTQKFYPATNSFLTVESSQTDGKGQTLTHLELENSIYKFIVEQGGSVIYTGLPFKAYCTVAPCVYELIVGGSAANPFTNLTNISGITYSFNYTNASGLVTLNWNDVSGLTPTVRLQTTKIGGIADTLICNNSLASTAGTLYCNLSNQTGEFQSIAYISRSPEHFWTSIYTTLTTNYKVFGDEAIIYGLLIMIALIFMSLWHPIASLVMTLVGFIFLSMMGLMLITSVFLLALTIIIIFIIWRMRT